MTILGSVIGMFRKKARKPIKFYCKWQGGYVLYRYTVMADSHIYTTHTILSCVHLLSPLHIPYANTEDLILRGAYIFVDGLQQHYTNYESLSLRERNQQL